MEEALQRVDEEGLVIASNARLSRAILEHGNWQDDNWQEISKAFPCWSGTMAAYDSPGKKLGKQIEYTDPETGICYTFPVPEKYQGRKNVILVSEHPNFTIVRDGGERIIQASEVDALKQFPSSNGWYVPNSHYEIPLGGESDKNQSYSRFLWRADRRVGLIVRDVKEIENFNFRRAVYMNCPPSTMRGVAVEGTWGQIAEKRRLYDQKAVEK